jgi:hypothetical protein
LKSEYSLGQLLAFAQGDRENLSEILISFINSSNEDLKHLNKYILDEDTISIEKLAHKMLPLLRQLETGDIVELLISLERNSFQRLDKNLFYSNAKMAVEKIEKLILTIKNQENINMN